MIRTARPDDTEAIVDVWDAASRIAHGFLGEEFLAEERNAVAGDWLPVAETTVFEVDGRVVGFVSMVGNEVGGLFVHPEHQGRGIGRTLIDRVRTSRPSLELDVFEANTGARRFYESCGFVEVGRHRHEPTGQLELRMRLGRPAP